jgi:protein TonB
MNLSRNEYIIAVGVILTHVLFITLGLVDLKSKNKDSSDVIRAQLIQPPPSVAPQATPTPPAQPKNTKPSLPKESTKTIAPEGTKPSNEKPTTAAPSAAPPTPSEGVAGGQSAPTNVSLSQLVILYKPDTEAFYPAFSKRIGEEGNVEVRLQIDESGNVQTTQVSLSSGSPRLDKAAMDLAQKIRFKPYLQNGVPIKIFAKIGVKFKLKD